MFLARSTREEKSGTFLCLRRGVSWISPTTGCRVDFSLPTQRCFYLSDREKKDRELFSAYAEVFLRSPDSASPFDPFLCLRRGVSPKRGFVASARSFSLPTQRCFLSEPLPCFPDALFSAYAEVFRRERRLPGRSTPFLCLRRGVSPKGE